MELALPEPPWFARLAATNPRLGRITFGARAHCLHVATERLHLPCQQADADAQRLAAEQCERELSALQAAAGFAARVRALLFSAQGLRDVEAVARALGMSSRTLKRRLAGEDTSYSALLDQERRARAEALLTHGTLSVKEVAAALGYADTAAFTHAFTRWTGEPPSEFSARARNALTPAR